MFEVKMLKAAVAVLAAAGMACAHLDTKDLKPVGGEAFSIGTVTKVTWTVSILHDGNMNIDFSKDNGKTWSTIKAFHADATGLQTFNWTPNVATTEGKIRICQTAGGPACTDAQNTTNNNSFVPYILVTPSFTVTSGTKVFEKPWMRENATLDFDPGHHSVDASFSLSKNGPVLLQAFDSQGRLLATLVQKDFAPGSHTLSLFSNRLETQGGALVFKLRIGDQVLSHTVSLVR